MDTLLRDVRLGLALLRKEKAFSGTVLLTLALCIGANVTIFGVIHAVLLQPLPYADSDRLVTVFNGYPGAGVERGGVGSFDFFQRRENIEAFEEVAVFQGAGFAVGEQGTPEMVDAGRVTPSLFPLLGVEAAVGRTFTEDEMEVGNADKAVLTWAFWQERFGGDRAAVGRELRADGRPLEIVGVLPRDFRVLGQEDARLFVPLAFSEGQRTIDEWHNNNFEMIARLRPGASVARAQSQVDALNAALVEGWPVPNGAQILADAGYHTRVVDAREDLIRDVRGTLLMLWGGVGFVLLIGCVNVANLMLARAQVRRVEMTTRLALGAGRGRVARQVLTEALVMGVLGAGAGVGLGALGLKLVTALGMDDLPRTADIALDGTVLAFAFGLGMAAALLFGALPALDVFRGDLNAVFRSESRTGTASRRAVLLRSGLVTGQVALAFLLLVGAALLLMSFRAALSVDPGFEPEGVLTASVGLPSARYPDADARRQFLDELMARVRALPGVESAGVTDGLPFSGRGSASVILPEGYVPRPGESLLAPFNSRVGPGYFEAMGVRLVEGRVFEEGDGPDRTRALVIDEWLARRYWPDRSAVGARMVWEAIPGADSVPEENLFTIVGVVETVKHADLTAAASEHVGAYFFTYRQMPPGGATLAVRARSGDPAALAPALRRVVTGLDPELPLTDVRTMEERLEASLADRRAPMAMLLIFAGVALFLAVVGIYGALAYSVTQRTREMGIRLAVGSGPDALFRMVLAQGLRVTATGLVAGIVAAILLARTLRALLFGVQATDPVILAAVAGLLAATAVVASVIPAWRATRVNPVRALGAR